MPEARVSTPRREGGVGFGPLERPRPLPYRVADEILGKILADGLRPGDQLPSEQEIAGMSAVIDDAEAASVEDLQFHRALARATGNEFYLVAMDALVTPLLEIRRSTFGPGGRAHEALDDHRALLTRVAARDEQGARDEMRRHLGDVERAWERMAEATDMAEGPHMA